MTLRFCPAVLWLAALLTALFSVETARAQIATGSWQDQVNFTRCVDVAIDGEESLIVVGAETAVFAMVLDGEGKATGELQRFGRAQGLSRADVAAVAVAGPQQLAIVGYAEGTLDLIQVDVDGTLGAVLPVTDLSEADVLGDKRPNALRVVDDRVLVCTDIGVIEYDLVKLEVRDTWTLEDNGAPLPIVSAERQGGRWWLATPSGLWSAPVGVAFPGNPDSWTSEPALVGRAIMDIAALAGGDLVVVENREGADALWRRDVAGVWAEIDTGVAEEWTGLAAWGDRFWASTPFGVMGWDAMGQSGPVVSQVGNLFVQPMGLAGGRNGVWVAQQQAGVVLVDDQAVTVDGPYFPEGPQSNACVRVDAWNEFMWMATGGTDAGGVPLYRREGFSGKKGQVWRRIPPPPGEVGAEGIQDPMDVSIDPMDPERAAFGSLEEGVVRVFGPYVTEHWNPTNSPLDWNANWTTPRCAVSALDYDRQGNLWMVNEGTDRPLKMLDAEGGWHVFDIDGLGVSSRFVRILATQQGQVWILLAEGQGVAVLETQGTPTDPSDDDIRFLGQGEGQGGLPSAFAYAVEEDLDGEVWIGTLQGPAVFYQPAGLFGPEPIDAQQILIEQDGNFQLLLETETVRDIALDGGNRKWVATENSGVFLLSPDGREQIEHFTASNSPLPANEVYDVAIDQSSGLVYFATPRGVTAYRGTATNFTSELGGPLRVFPNPWRPTDPPNVTIDGLAFGTEVHIVNAAGRRVRQLNSAGGRAVWDTLDDLGQPVPQGVYFGWAGEAAGKSGSSVKMVILR